MLERTIKNTELMVAMLTVVAYLYWACLERSRKACGIATLRVQPVVEKCGLRLRSQQDKESV
ncbi:MAG: hypothetical protein KME50_11495 [Nostoc desertorum CM1-VF14]|nr:hypothetical protein [Nostoc desertorum CM1-VF14]